MSNKLKSQEKANRIAEIDDHIRRSFDIIKVNGNVIRLNTTFASFKGLRSTFSDDDDDDDDADNDSNKNAFHFLHDIDYHVWMSSSFPLLDIFFLPSHFIIAAAERQNEREKKVSCSESHAMPCHGTEWI